MLKEEKENEANYFERIVQLAANSRDLQRKLNAELGHIISRRKISLGHRAQSYNRTEGVYENDEQRDTFKLLQAANLNELALVERELSQTSSSLQLFASEPNLDDKVLFPSDLRAYEELLLRRLSSGRHGDEEEKGAAHLEDPNFPLRAEFEFCSYTRHLYDRLAQNATDGGAQLQVDPVGLLPVGLLKRVMRLNESGSALPSGRQQFNWRQDLESLNPSARQRRRASLAADFSHMRRLDFLGKLLARRLSLAANAQEDADESDEDSADLARRQQQRTAAAAIVQRSSESLSLAKRAPLEESQDADADDDDAPFDGHHQDEPLPPAEPAAAGSGGGRSARELAATFGALDLMLGFVGEPVVGGARGGGAGRFKNVSQFANY